MSDTKLVVSYCVVRRGNGPLHIASATGRGYATICGHQLAGADLDVPRPRGMATRRMLDRFWGKCWALELTCLKCENKVAAK